jgi:two-component system response regulator MprA
VTRHRVLVVDDEEDVRDLVARVLEDAGYLVDVAGDGHDALARIDSARPDLIVMDLMMPHLDGWGLLRRLRAHSDRPNVVVLSAALDPTRLHAEGVTAFHPKPFAIRDLLQVCAAALR